MVDTIGISVVHRDDPDLCLANWSAPSVPREGEAIELGAKKYVVSLVRWRPCLPTVGRPVTVLSAFVFVEEVKPFPGPTYVPAEKTEKRP